MILLTGSISEHSSAITALLSSNKTSYPGNCKHDVHSFKKADMVTKSDNRIKGLHISIQTQ